MMDYLRYYLCSLMVLVGIAGVLGSFLILSFYSVVGGWSLNYTWSTLTGDLGQSSGVDVGDYFTTLLGQPGTLLFWQTIFMLLTFGIVAGGTCSTISK